MAKTNQTNHIGLAAGKNSFKKKWEIFLLKNVFPLLLQPACTSGGWDWLCSSTE
ncbi:MAG: hypothetical protein GXC78_01435 [Chitinophagaceae bacterium]|nr:hypothetical protein [Chitinophagaceae bacterium]